MISLSRIESGICYLSAHSILYKYILTFLMVAAATAATYYLPGLSEWATVLFFVLAVVLAAYSLGYLSALTAIVLSLISVNGFILFPLWVKNPYGAFTVNASFITVCVIVIAAIRRQLALSDHLRQRQQELNHAQAIGQIGNWRMDIRENKLLMSDEGLRIYGIPKGTPLTYKSLLAAVHPADRDNVDVAWKSGLRGEPYDIEHRIIVVGEEKWVRERAEPEFGNNNQLLCCFGITQDITTRKKAELSLTESQQRYADIVESAMDAIISIDADRLIVLFNSAAEKMFGFKADEIMGKSIDNLIPERFRHAHGEYIVAFGRSGITTRRMGSLGMVCGLRANGEEFPIEAAISQYNINGDKFFTVILRDITGRQAKENALYEQIRLQDQLAKVAASVPGVICSFRLAADGTASMPFASPFFENIYGIDSATVKEDFTPVFNRIHPDDINRVNETISESARTLEPWHDSFRYRHPVKGEIWIEGHSVPRLESDGCILWHGYIQDVTERKQAEQNITRLNQNLRHRIEEMNVIFDTAPIGLAVADDPTGTHILGNLTNERMLGLPPGSELSKKSENAPNYRSFHNGRELDVTELPMQRAVKGEVVTNFLMEIHRPDGLSIIVLCNAKPLLNEKGFPRGAIGAFLEVTDSIKSKEISLLRGKIEHKSREQVAIQTAAAIAHELNQPLTAISYYADAALGMLNPDSPQPQKLIHILEKCGKQAQRAGDVFRRLTELLNKDETISEAIDINLCIKEAYNLIMAQEQFNGFEIKLDLAGHLPPVSANGLQIIKVMAHLIENGLEAMRESGLKNGSLTIITRLAANAPGMAQVTVRDCGKGAFNSADFNKFFQPFHSSKPGGLGLGLPISKGLIEANGGKLWVEQNEDAGLSFHFTLPFAEKK